MSFNEVYFDEISSVQIDYMDDKRIFNIVIVMFG